MKRVKRGKGEKVKRWLAPSKGEKVKKWRGERVKGWLWLLTCSLVHYKTTRPLGISRNPRMPRGLEAFIKYREAGKLLFLCI